MLTKYFTLYEVLKSLDLWNDNYETGSTENTLIHQFQLFLSAVGYDSTDLTTDQKSDIAENLWTTYIVGRYMNTLAVITENDDLRADDIKQFAIKYLQLFNRTVFKYKTMLNLYQANLDKLMDGVKVTSENKYNDTPQNAQGTYSWNDDTHLSNVARNESTSEVMTKMARIDEIQTNIRNLYSDWAREFWRLFLYD